MAIGGSQPPAPGFEIGIGGGKLPPPPDAGGGGGRQPQKPRWKPETGKASGSSGLVKPAGNETNIQKDSGAAYISNNTIILVLVCVAAWLLVKRLRK